MDNAFADFIKGKSVCVVGPAPVMIGRGLGKEVESFDVVVKTGNAPTINDPNYFHDYGRRCDVLYINRSTYTDFREIPLREWKTKGVRHVRLRTSDARHAQAMAPHFHTEKIPDLFYEPISETQDDVPLMGVVIVRELLAAGAGRVYLTGFDFNTSRGESKQAIDLPRYGDFREYVPGYLTETMRKRLNNLRLHNTKDAHDHLANGAFFHSAYLQGKIEMPGFVLEKLCLLLATVAAPERTAC